MMCEAKKCSEDATTDCDRCGGGVCRTCSKITVPSRGDISIRHKVCPRPPKTGVMQPEVSASNRRNTNGKQ